MYKVAVLGLGFVGLTTAVGFAKHGIRTYGFDVVESKRNAIKSGKAPFFEEGLDDALADVINKELFISDTISECLSSADVIFLCMGTPMGEDGSADLSYILNALDNVCDNLSLCNKTPIVVVKSTVPPSSSLKVFIPYLEKKGIKVGEDKDLILCNNPEFLREGYAYSDFMNPDRVVIGTSTCGTIKVIDDIYKPFKAPVVFTSLNTAEFIKYLSNTVLSTFISFANELSLIAEHIGDINIKQAFNVLAQDKRFSGNPANFTTYIYPGLGFGGYCLPKDTNALVKKSIDNGYTPSILKAVLDVNNSVVDERAKLIYDKVENKDSCILIMGLSFKPNSDDVRDSRSKILIEKLKALGYKNIIAYDPIAVNIFKHTYNIDIPYYNDIDEAIAKADYYVLATAWDVIKDKFNTLPSDRKFDFRFI